MKGFLRLTLALSVAVPLAARAAAPATDVPAKLDQYMNAAAKVEHFMGSVLVARGDKVLLAKGYGMADLENKVPNTPDTEYRIGSITKQFTAMAILMLQAEGKLNVQDPVCKYVPKCPRDWAPIKLTNLLTHTSGIPDLTDFKNFEKTDQQPHTPAEVLALFENKPLEFKPGARFRYSSSNYEVLGYIVSRVSGESYRKFLQQHIFGPLGMKNSGYDSSHPAAKNHAKGYDDYDDGAYKPAEYVDMSVPYAAGALYSTVRDLYKWDRALAAGRLIPQPLQKQMFAPQAPVGGELAALEGPGKVYYGYGWFVSHRFGHLEYSHEGGIQGYTSFNSWYPGQHVYVIVLDNMTSPDIFTIGKSLAAIVFGQPYKVPQAYRAISLPAKDLKKFVGQYRLTPKLVMTITQDGDQLSEQLTGQSAHPIYPESKTRFFLKVVRAEIRFTQNAKGEVTGLVLHQGGRQISARKIGGAGEPKAIELPAAELQRFVGTYRLTPDFSITITRDGDQLSAQATGQEAFPIYPESQTEFFLKVVDAEIRFVTDDQGQVTGLVLHQNGRDTPAKKIE